MKIIIFGAKFFKKFCNILVHKSCYNLKDIPSTKEFWFCDPCFQYLITFLNKNGFKTLFYFIIDFEKRVIKIKKSLSDLDPKSLTSESNPAKIRELRRKKNCSKIKKNHSLVLDQKSDTDNKFLKILNNLLLASNISLSSYNIKKSLHKCMLCGLKGGPMFLTSIKNEWAHLSCAYWIKEIGFDFEKRILMITHLKNSFNKIKCIYCEAKVGLTTSCYENDCNTHFHVECARRLLCEMLMPYNFSTKQSHHVVFCINHSQTYTSRKFTTLSNNYKFRCPIFLSTINDNHFYNLHKTDNFYKKVFRKYNVKDFHDINKNKKGNNDYEDTEGIY